MKTALRIGLLVVLIWALSKVVANAPGGITPGTLRSKRQGPSSDWRSQLAGAGDLYTATGMVGDMIQNSSIGVSPVGQPLTGPQVY